MVRDDDADVLVVGGGLAGLTCARTLERAGLSVIVLEADDEVGGRMRTELVDGFLCDRGSSARPIRRCAGWSTSTPWTCAPSNRRGRPPRPGLAVLADPRREPRQVPATCAAGTSTSGKWSHWHGGRPRR